MDVNSDTFAAARLPQVVAATTLARRTPQASPLNLRRNFCAPRISTRKPTKSLNPVFPNHQVNSVRMKATRTAPQIFVIFVRTLVFSRTIFVRTHRDLRAHNAIFVRTSLRIAQRTEMCANRRGQLSVISAPASARLRPSLAARSSEGSIRESPMRETALDRWRWGHYLSRPRRKIFSFHGTDSQNNHIVPPDRFGLGCKNLYTSAEKRSCGTWSNSVKSRPRYRPSMDAQRLNRAAQ
jgi:hypothetical protein